MTATATNGKASKHREGHDAFGSIEKRRQVYREVWNTEHNVKVGKLLDAIAAVRVQLLELADDEPEIVEKFEERIDCYETRLRAAEINLGDLVSQFENFRCKPMNLPS